MMKTRIHTLLPAALLLLATACEDTLNAPGNPATGNGPTLTLALDNREDNGQTRSELTDGAPVNHVQSVRILVFKVTGDNATYEGEEIYTGGNEGAIAWPEPEGDQEKPYQITYQMNYPFVEDETYTLLGVGQDDQFATTYGIDLTPGTTTLANAYAKLKKDASPKECDFYTGTTTFTYEGRDTHIDDLRMKRRVAGVLLYVNEIPADLPYNNATYRTTRIDLKLGRTQKKSVQLYRDFLAEEWTEPGGEDLTDSDVLLSIDLSTLDYTKKDNQGFYTIDNTDNGLQDDALKAACYMLPLNVPTGKAVDYKTFTVEIYGEKLRSDVTDGTTEEGTEALLKSFTVEQRDTDGKSVTSFPIRSNYLYSIGKYNPDAGVDEPISLSGSPIYLEVLPFQKLNVNHEFGEARVQALFNPDFDEEYIFNCMNEVIPIKILPPLTTIRNRVKSIRLAIVDKNQTTVIDEDGKEATETEEYYNNWLYVETQSNNQTIYRKDLDITELVKDKEGEIKLLMLDYARPRKEWGWNIDGGNNQWIGDNTVVNNINNDIRYTDIYLYTDLEWDQDGDGEFEKSTRTDVLRIRQYNTITVYYKGWDSTPSCCGFSRYDYDEFNNDTQDNTWGWGFQGSNNNLVYSGKSGHPVAMTTGSYDNGSANQNGIFWSTTFNDSWQGCAIQRSNHPFKKITDTGTLETKPDNFHETNNNNNSELGWYLPAQHEMEGLMIMCADNTNSQLIKGNITENQKYWTSTLSDGGTENKTITCTLKDENGSRSYVTEELERSGNACRIRQARHFSDYSAYGGQW